MTNELSPLPLEEQVRACILREKLCSESRRIAVALSGGSDSVALLRALHRLGYEVEALHCNFHLRGEESDRDEAFVRELCRTLGIPLHTQHYDTHVHCREQGVSVEMAARQLRYTWFAEWAKAAPGVRIAIAHNRQDMVETLLLNLAKGTGIRGLSGMPYRRDGYIIRPLMDVMPHEIQAYLQALGQPYCLDSTNADESYQRNYIRHTLLPALERINPRATDAIARTIAHLRGVEALYAEAIERYTAEVCSAQGIHIPRLLLCPAPEALLYELLHPHGFSPEQATHIARRLPELPSGAHFESPTHTLVRSWDYLSLAPRGAEAFALSFFPADGLRVETPLGTLVCRVVPRGELSCLRVSPEEVLLDWDALCRSGDEALRLTTPPEGLRIKPFGIRGSKLVSRVFIDKKLGYNARRRALVLMHGGETLWIVGVLASRCWAVSPQTERVLRLSLCP